MNKIALFALAAVAPLALASHAYAETADEAAPAVAEIVVTGRPIAESEAAALEVQKLSDSLVAVAAADAVGRLPDQNIAQAAGRLPGVAVESDQGQPRYISIRGGPKAWTTLSFDGVNVISPEGRDARFDSVPSAIAKQIVVSKAVTPDLPGETVAGNVNVVTRSALDYSGLRVTGKVGAGQAEYGDRRQYDLSGVVSNRFDVGTGELGVLLAASYFQRNMITDNFESDWERVPNDQRPGFETRYWAAEVENKLYRLARKNWSVSGRVDWKLDEDNLISARSIFTTFTDDEARNNYRFDADQFESNLVATTAPCTITVNPTPTTSGYGDVCIGNTPFQGTLYGVRIRQRSTLRAFEQSIFTNTLEGQHAFGDGWRLNWLGNYTESKDDRSVVGEASWQSASRAASPTVAYDLSDPDRSHLVLYNTVSLTGPTRFQAGSRVVDVDSFNTPLNSFTVLDAVDTTKAYTSRVVLAKDTELFGAQATLKAGFQFDQRSKEAVENQISLSTAAQFATAGLPTSFNAFTEDRAFQGEIAMDYTFHYFDTDKMRAASKAARANFAFSPVTANDYEVREQVYAGYAMGTLRYDWGSVIGGVRVERLNNTGEAVATIGTANTPVKAEVERTLVFPSLHVNYNLDETKKVRISFNTGAARADYDQLRPNVVISDTNSTISGGNPAVKPERAQGVDAYFEWYVQPQGYLMVGAFYKDISDVLFTQRRTFGSDALNTNGVDRSDYTFTGIANAGDGRLYGLEAAAQFQLEPFLPAGLPEWTGGFGVSANVTYNDSEITKPAVGVVPTRKVRLPNTSDVVLNVGPYFEKYGLSVKLQYKYRTKWLDGLSDDDTDGGDFYWATDDELDLSARYAVSDVFEIYVDATNLLDNPGRRFVDPAGILTAKGVPTASSSARTIEWERFGRRFAAGVRFTF